MNSNVLFVKSGLVMSEVIKFNIVVWEIMQK